MDEILTSLKKLSPIAFVTSPARPVPQVASKQIDNSEIRTLFRLSPQLNAKTTTAGSRNIARPKVWANED